jgi:hypothetical protein
MFVCIEINGREVMDPTLVGITPGRDLRVFGPFDTSQQAAGWIKESGEDEEKFVILTLEWYRRTN